MTITPVNDTAVRVLWEPSIIFSTRLVLISSFTATGMIMREYETVLPPGVASTDVVIENGLTLDESKEEIEHNFTLHYVYTMNGITIDGPETTATFALLSLCITFVQQGINV